MNFNFDDDGKIVLGKGVKLNAYKPRPTIQREFLTENELRNNAGGDLILDVESYINYFTVGFKHVQTGKYISLDNDFSSQFLSWLLFSYRTVGFNSIRYDLIVLWAAYVNRDPGFLKSVTEALIVQGKRANEVEREFGFKCYPLQKRQHIDLFDVCPLKGSLKLYGARLHSLRLQDLPFPDDERLDDWQIPIVRDYNYNDLDVTEQIFKFCKERLELRESISLEYDEDLMSKSDAQMAEIVIKKEVSKLNKKWVKRIEIPVGTTYKYSVPKFLMYATKPMQDLLARVKKADFTIGANGKIIPPKELEEPVQIGNSWYSLGIGGLHSKDKRKAYEAKNGYKLRDTDVTSYYPNAIINMGLCPPAMGPNFLTVYKGFKDQRVEAKKTKQFTKDKGLKIFLNGVSGKFSDVYSSMYGPANTIQMNLTGQLSILMLAEMFECNGIEVVSANTDGIVSYYKEEDEYKVEHWIKYWEELTGFQLEHVYYTKYYARDVNAYFAVKDDGSVKVKGPYSEVGSQSGTQLDNNPISLVCSDAIKLFLSKGVPFEETILNCKDFTRFIEVRNVKGGAHKNGDFLGRVVRWYKAKNEYGTINYVLTGNKVANTEGAKPVMDLPTIWPDDLDYQWYIDNCKSILYDIGYLVKPKQIEFF